MPFTPHPNVLALEKRFMSYLLAISRLEKCHGTAVPTRLEGFPVKDSIDVLDEDNKLLDAFYTQILSCIQYAMNIRALYNGTPKTTTEDVAGITQEIFLSMVTLIRFTQYLQDSHPSLFDHLTRNLIGRAALNYLICTSIMHQDPWKIEPHAIKWIDAMMAVSEEKDSVFKDEIESLVYIRFLANKSDPSDKTTLISLAEKNPFIHAHLILGPKGEYSSPHHAMRITNVLQRTFNYPKTLPSITKGLISLTLNFKAIIALIEQSDNKDRFYSLFSRYISSTLCDYLPDERATQINRFFYIIHLLSEDLRWFNYLYSYFLDQGLILYEYRNVLLCTHICVSHAFEKESLTSLAHHQLTHSIARVFERKLHEYWEATPETVHLFWKAVVAIFRPKKEFEIRVEALAIFQDNIHMMLNTLARLNKIEDLNDLLSSYLSYFPPPPPSSAKKKNRTSGAAAKANPAFGALKHLLEFYISCQTGALAKQEASIKLQLLLKDIPAFNAIKRVLAFYTKLQDLTLPAKKTNKAFQELVEQCSTGAFDFRDLTASFLSEKLPVVQKQLQVSLHHALNETKAHLSFASLPKACQKNLHHFHHVVATLYDMLGASKEMKDEALEALHHKSLISHQLADVLKKEEREIFIARQKKQEDKMRDSASPHSPMTEPSPAASPVSFFQPAEKPLHTIPKKALPPYLIELAHHLKETQELDLILTGGAVTLLLLERGLPYDYDCIVFDADLVALSHEVERFGATKCNVVGKGKPVLKIVHDSPLGQVKIDIISIPSKTTNREIALHRAMQTRDFKLSALYTYLTTASDNLVILGGRGAIGSVVEHRIVLIGSREYRFTEDPVRLIRLAKIMLQLPDFELDDQLKALLKPELLSRYFESYLSDKKDANIHWGRLSSAIEMLFERFDFNIALQKLDALGLISAMTTLNPSHLRDTLESLDKFSSQCAYIKKVRLFQWLTIHYCLLHPEDKTLSHWPFYGVAKCLHPIQSITIEYIQQKLLEGETSLVVNDPVLKELISTISCYYESHALPLSQATTEENTLPSWRS